MDKIQHLQIGNYYTTTFNYNLIDKYLFLFHY